MHHLHFLIPHRSWIEIDREALLANIQQIRSLLERGTRLLGVVKANAYGHGLVLVARTIEGRVDWFGVDSIEEAIELRTAGIKAPILILGFTPPERAAEIIRYDLRQVVYDLEMIGALDDASRYIGQRAAVHIKIETGMARQGVRLENLARFCLAAKEFKGVTIEGVSTHLADAENVDDPSFTDLQLSRFHMALDVCTQFGIYPKVRHAGASSAAMLHATARFDLVRIGIALYGLWPAPHLPQALQSRGKSVRLQPALSFRTRIAQINDLPAGSPVGYGLTERVHRDSRIAILPVGYADGYDRRLSSRGFVLIAGKRAKVLGRVMMNITVVDVTDIPEATPACTATLIGHDGNEQITVEEIAEMIETIPYEIVSRLNPLIPRVLV